jgi:hypothetical protein
MERERMRAINAIRFDALSRTFAIATRRAVLRLSLAGLITPLGLTESEAKKRKRRKSKRSKNKKPEPTCAESCPAPCGT